MSDTAITKEQVHAAFSIVSAVGEAIRDLGSVPSGELYARLMDHFTLSEYNSVINLLKRTGMVKESGHLLTWIGPKKGEA